MSATAGSAAHIREHRSVLAAGERRLLIWIAERLPASISPDHLSALSLAAMACCGLAFIAYRWTNWAAAAVVLSLAAHWFGDSLDGTVARVRGIERPRYGYYVDHVLDLAATAFLLAGLACSPLMTPVVALALLAAFFAVSAESYLCAHTAGVFRLSFLGVGPTELRAGIAIAALQAARTPYVVVGGMRCLLFDAAGVIGTMGVAVAFGAAAARNGAALYAAEPRR